MTESYSSRSKSTPIHCRVLLLLEVLWSHDLWTHVQLKARVINFVKHWYCIVCVKGWGRVVCFVFTGWTFQRYTAFGKRVELYCSVPTASHKMQSTYSDVVLWFKMFFMIFTFRFQSDVCFCALEKENSASWQITVNKSWNVYSRATLALYLFCLVCFASEPPVLISSFLSYLIFSASYLHAPGLTWDMNWFDQIGGSIFFVLNLHHTRHTTAT